MSVWSCVHPAVNPSKKFYQHGLIDPYMYSKTCLVPGWRCKGTFVIGKVLDHVNIGQLTSAVKCVCGFWLAGIIVPRDSKCKILLQFWQKQLWATCTPSTSGMVVLAWGLQSTCIAVSWWKNREMGCTGTNGSNSHMLLLGCSYSAGSSYERGTVQSTRTASGSLLHVSVWLPKQRAGKLGSIECSSLGKAFLSRGTQQKLSKASGSPVAKAVLVLASCVVPVPLHLLSQLRPHGLRQRNTEML